MKMKTKTQTKTQSVTTTKMAVATLALFLANGLAFIALPLGSQQQAQLAQVRGAVNPPRDCGVLNYATANPCANNTTYRNATFTCKDNQVFRMGDGRSCYSIAEIEKKGEAFCYNHCAETRPQLTVSAHPDMPLGTNLLSGARDQSVAKFKISNNGVEKVNLNDFVVSFHGVNGGATSTVNAASLVDEEGFVVAGPVAVITSNSSTFAHASFENLNLVLGLNKTKVFTVKVNIHEFGTGRFQPVIISGDYDGTRAGIQLSIGAIGENIGRLEQRDIVFRPRLGDIALGSLSDYVGNTGLSPVPGNVEGNQFVSYRAKLQIAWSPDTPFGASIESANQLIGKIRISNDARGRTATLNTLNFQVTSNGFDQARQRELRVYRDSLNIAPLATTRIYPGQGIFSGKSDFSDQQFTDVEILPGETKTFLVTYDTVGALATTTLSVTIPGIQSPEFHIPSRSWFPPSYTYDYSLPIRWGDDRGVGSILAHDLMLPLVPKTFIY